MTSRPRTLAARIVAYLRDKGPRTTKQIWGDIGEEQGRVANLLSYLVVTGRIAKSKCEACGGSHVYRVEEGK